LVQTTLLGLAIAIILALLAALIGPWFVDWTSYRAGIEAEASRIVGAPVRVAGSIDLRLLPTPYVSLKSVRIGTTDGAAELSVPALEAELALGPLMRGQWRAEKLRLVKPDIRLAIDRVAASDDRGGANVEIATFAVEDGSLELVDHGKSRGRLQQVSFAGQAQSLTGPFKGEGRFSAGKNHYDFRIASGRRGEDGGAKLHLGLDITDQPFSFEADGAVFRDGGLRFTGTATLNRIAALALGGGRVIQGEPWRATAKVEATADHVLFDQLDVAYGPDERAAHVTGTARLALPEPRLDLVLSAAQLDVDRALALSDTAQRVPRATLEALTAKLTGEFPMSVPVQLGFAADSVQLGGGQLQAVRADARFDGAQWHVDRLELRAPGYTMARLSGDIGASGFKGPADISSDDPRALLTWLSGHSDPKRGTIINPLHLRGAFAVDGTQFAANDLSVEFDRRTFSGRFIYRFAAQQPARLEAAIEGADVDGDSLIAFAQAASSGAPLPWPGEVDLAMDIGRLGLSGMEARGIKAKLAFDDNGLRVEQFSAADFGGAVINGRGALNFHDTPRGTLALSIEAQQLDGIAALLERWLPDGPSRAVLTRLAPANIGVTANVGADASGGPMLRVAVGGRAGPLQLNAGIDGHGDPSSWRNAPFQLKARLAGDDAATLASVLALDRYLDVDQRPAVATLTASRGEGADILIETAWNGGGLDASAKGSVAFADDGVRGNFDVATAGSTSLASKPGLPFELKGRLAIAPDEISVRGVSGSVAGSNVSGEGKVTLSQPRQIDADVTADRLAVGALLAAASGEAVASSSEQALSLWPTAPFGPRALAGWTGQVRLDATQAGLGPGLSLRNLRTTVKISPSSTRFEDIAAMLGAGRFAGQVSLSDTSGGTAVAGRISLHNADSAAVVPAVAGRLSGDLRFEGAGLSPAALIGSLQGDGTLSLENGQFSGLDLRVFDEIEHAVERDSRIDQSRVGEIATKVFDSGALVVPSASAPLVLSQGRLLLGSLDLRGGPNGLAASGSLDLAALTLDGKVSLQGQGRPNVASGRPPVITAAYKGPWLRPTRSIDTGMLTDWLTLVAVEREMRRLENAERAAKANQVVPIKLQDGKLQDGKLQEGAPPPSAPKAGRDLEPSTASAAPTPPTAPPLPPAIIVGPAPKPHPRAKPPSRPLPITPFSGFFAR
jgi:large subunit ribosomal protein L24